MAVVSYILSFIATILGLIEPFGKKMKTIFIVNPCAGQGDKAQILVDRINKICDMDKEVYLTKAIGDATRYVEAYIKNHGPARFITCGVGDRCRFSDTVGRSFSETARIGN